MQDYTGRVKGFVVGSDDIAGTKTWKVRVNDKFCPLDGQKLIVGSVHDQIALDKGLEVTFLVGKFKGGDGEYNKAVDVKPTVMTPHCHICMDGERRNTAAEVVIEASYNNSGAASYAYACMSHVILAAQGLRTMHPNNPYPIFKIMSFDRGDKDWRPLYGV